MLGFQRTGRWTRTLPVAVWSRILQNSSTMFCLRHCYHCTGMSLLQILEMISPEGRTFSVDNICCFACSRVNLRVYRSMHHTFGLDHDILLQHCAVGLPAQPRGEWPYTTTLMSSYKKGPHRENMYFFSDIHELLVFPAEVVKIDELASTVVYSLQCIPVVMSS